MASMAHWSTQLLPHRQRAPSTVPRSSLPLPCQLQGPHINTLRPLCRATFEKDDFLQNRSIPDAEMAKALGLNEEYLTLVLGLPGSSSLAEIKSRLVSLSTWHNDLRRGILPAASEVSWPQEPMRSKFLDVLKRLEMPRFTRRHPKLLASLMRQFLDLVSEFESALSEEEQKNSSQKQQKRQSSPQQSSSQASGDSGEEAGESGESGDIGSNGEPGESQPSGTSDNQDAGETSNNVDMQLDMQQGGGGSQSEETSNDDASSEDAYANKLADTMLKKLEEQWAPAMEALEIATGALDDVDSLMDGPEGFDLSSSLWQDSGWREVAALSKKLESLRELRELVRSLGRGGGKGPLKRAPREVYQPGRPPGVILSEQSPEETRGLTRSGDLARMLPLEARLIAAGRSQENEGSRAARLLFMVRRAERQLLSYERSGWLDDQPSRVTDRLEMRPAQELGPIIVCLDTSGSMSGAREVVAKALVLEAMRGAFRQHRRCIIYAFSGPGDVMELELDSDAPSMSKLLGFLRMSFLGGTDVDAPLALSLDRLGREGWELADILMVTDGEINNAHPDIRTKLERSREDLGLKVHGLLVGNRITPAMEELCSDVHVFKSWTAVGGRPFEL